MSVLMFLNPDSEDDTKFNSYRSTCPTFAFTRCKNYTTSTSTVLIIVNPPVCHPTTSCFIAIRRAKVYRDEAEAARERRGEEKEP